MKYLKDGWLILALAIVFASALTGVQATLGPIIEKNQKDKTYRRIPMLTLGVQAVEGLAVEAAAPEIKLLDQSGETVKTLRVEETPKGSAVKAYRVYEGDTLLGYVVEGSGAGYADKIALLVGLSEDLQTVTGASVIKQMETPSLGDKIAGPWANQYAGKAVLPPLEVVKNKTAAPDNNKIDAISGATISSRATTDIVNNTVAEFSKELPSLTWESGEESVEPAADSDDEQEEK